MNSGKWTIRLQIQMICISEFLLELEMQHAAKYPINTSVTLSLSAAIYLVHKPPLSYMPPSLFCPTVHALRRSSVIRHSKTKAVLETFGLLMNFAY
jgi:hypothetical protein